MGTYSLVRDINQMLIVLIIFGLSKSLPKIDDVHIHLNMPEIQKGKRVMTRPEMDLPVQCKDENYYCQYWSSIGECQRNPYYMLVHCKKSCKACTVQCKDENNYCQYWSSIGHCHKNPYYMQAYCKKSCKTCTGQLEGEDECSCGKANRGETNRISGGDKTLPNEYPWMVRIFSETCQYTPEKHFSNTGVCGGSLVSPKVVLSAYHCPKPASDCKLHALLGMHTITKGFSDEEDKIPILEALYPPHAGFSGNQDNQNTENSHDFQMYVLDREAKYTRKVSPICLPEPNAEFGGKQATAAGWGFYDETLKFSPELRSVELTVVKRKYFEKKMFGTKLIKKNGVYQDPCGSDSGGPLMFYNDKTARYVLIGTVQGEGYDCRTGRVNPMNYGEGVWNMVSAHMEWIQNKMKELGEKVCM